MALSLLSDDSPEALPVTTSPNRSRLPARRRVFAFLATAAFSGILFQLCLTVLYGHRREARLRPWSLGQHTEQVHEVGHECDVLHPTVLEPAHTVTKTETITHIETPVPNDSQEALSGVGDGMRIKSQTDEGKDDMSLESLREMVSRTKGYFARDWSVGLGWNNVRYIIEAALLQSSALNRTLIIPSFVYARACEYADDICSAYATLVDRERAVGWDKWHGAPLNTLAWHIPIEVMLDLPHLRRNHAVLLMSEYLKLQGLPPDLESLAGDWDSIGYHEGPLSPTLHVIPNKNYDPKGTVRVDRLGAHRFEAKHGESRVNTVLEEKIGTRRVAEVSEARKVLKEAGVGEPRELETDAGLEQVLNQGGWGLVYTFQSAGRTHYGKTVVDPTKQVVSFAHCRGFAEDYGDVTADVILLEGETHLRRKPGQMSFTSTKARDDFARTVLYDIRPIEKIRMLASRLDERLRKAVGGRMWMSAHMRRGDFVTVGMVHTKGLETHFSKIKTAVEKGRQKLLKIGEPKSFDVPEAKMDTAHHHLPKPEEKQPFYLATDERSPEGVQYLREHGALLIEDILTIEDRRLIGWPLLLTDVLGVVEQAVLARSSFFVGFTKSSVAGGVINMRAARGADPRTSMLDS